MTKISKKERAKFEQMHAEMTAQNAGIAILIFILIVFTICILLQNWKLAIPSGLMLLFMIWLGNRK